MTRAIVVTHGTLGQSLVAAAESVLGALAGTTVLSNSNLSLDQIQSCVSEHLSSDPTIIFVDLCGGSPYMACCSLPAQSERVAVVSGVNLPMLLSFFTKRDRLALPELVETVQRDAVRGIQRVPAA